MKQLKLVLKRILIIHVIIFITLSSMSSCQARGYDKKCGEYASKWAMDFINKYAGSSQYNNLTQLGSINGNSACRWSGTTNDDGTGTGTFYGCCTCWVHWIYYYALGVDINDFGFDPNSDTAYSNLKGGNQYFDDVTNESLQAGDILIVNGHAEMYAGDDQHVNFGSTPMNIHGACSRMTPGRSGENAIAVRLKSSVQVNPAGSIPVDEIEDENLNIYDENGFIYTGVAKIEGYKGTAPFGKWILKSLLQILDYIIGILTYVFRAVVVGWTAIIERLFIDGIVNAITGVTNKRDEGWQKDPNSIDEIDKEAEEKEKADNETQEQPQASGDENDPNEYISEGMQRIADIGGNVQLKTSSKANVTVENIVYNKIPILDINFFNFESAGGAVVDEDGIIYIIKENVATWYYIFRTMAILIMLIILLYLGIKMAISTVAEKKAVYKQMIVSWIAGFILVFTIHYIMYFIISVNETFVNWIIPKYENGTELSLYESVRSKAYSLKATTGTAGMVMYTILVYYSVRFLILYFKRFLTVMILAVISPFVAVSYAVQKINKNGKGGEMYGNWMRDFMYTVILQSIHALIYTIFVQTALDLTEVSIGGIFIAFIFLKFMLKVDPTVRKIFGFSGGKGKGSSADKLTIEEIGPQIKGLQAIAKSRVVKGTIQSQARFIGKVVKKPALAIANEIDAGASIVKEEITNRFGSNIQMTPEKEQEMKRKKKEKVEKRKQVQKGVKTGLGISKEMVKTFAKGLVAMPLVIAEPQFGITILDSAISSGEKTASLIRKAKKDGLFPSTRPTYNHSYTLTGIKPRNVASQQRLISRFNALGIDYTMYNGPAGSAGSGPIYNPTGGGAYYIPGEEDAEGLTQEEFRKRFKELSKSKLERVLEQIDLSNLKYASAKTSLEEVAEEEDIDTTELYAEILILAKEKEAELEEKFKELSGTTAEKIEEMKKVSPEFAKKMEEKKKQQLIKEARILAKPLSEIDIYKAIQSYQSKVPSFDPSSERIIQRDIVGIAKELNEILDKKGEGVTMSNTFISKVEKELANNQRRVAEKKEKEKNNDRVGSNVASKGKAKSLKEQIKELTATDNAGPNGSANAPQQNGGMHVGNSEGGRGTYGADINAKTEQNNNGGSGMVAGSSVERLVKNIKNASKGSSSKKSTTITPKALAFAKTLEEFEELNKESVKITGEELYDIDEVLRRLADL